MHGVEGSDINRNTEYLNSYRKINIFLFRVHKCYELNCIKELESPFSQWALELNIL